MRCDSLSYRRDYWNGQRHIVEVWSEKGTVRGVLQPILDEFGIGLRVMHGFTSTTVVKSIANVRKPIIALYVGDYDPSGMHMSEIDLPDRLVEYGGEHHRVIRIGLLDHDIEDLPSIAAKPTDPRFKWYSANYGKQAWELDALDPNVLRDRVRRAILSKIDQDEWDRAMVCEEAEQSSLQTYLAGWKGAA